MQVKVLGTVAPYPKGDLNCSSFLVEDDNKKVMLDAGFGSSRTIDIMKDLKNLAIIISHYHPDHYGDLLAIANQTFIAKKLGYLEKPVDIYIPTPNYEGNKVTGNWQTPVMFPSDSLAYDFLTKSGDVNYFKFHTYDEKTKLNIANMNITFKKTIHEQPAYSIKVDNSRESLVYSGDTGYQNNTLEEFARNSDLLICEATYLLGQPKGEDMHLYAGEAGKIAASANVGSLKLFHTYPEIDKEEYVREARQYYENVSSLHEGDILKLERRKENER